MGSTDLAPEEVTGEVGPLLSPLTDNNNLNIP